MSAGAREAYLDLLRPLVEAPQRAGLFCDFDGTLAAIVADPSAVVPLAGAPAILGSLAASLARVGVISGRPLGFLRTHLGDSGADLWGLYGLEHLTPGGVVETDPDALTWRTALDAAARAAALDLGGGVGVEPKGLSLTVHYRSDPAMEAEVGRWTRERAEASGLVAHPAKMSWELRVPLDRDKGRVLSSASAELSAVAFLGDDVGDLPGFDALDDLAAAGCHTVAIGVASAEAPSELLERADVVVDGPEAAVALLGSLADALDQPDRPV